MPIADICLLEDTDFTKGIDMEAYWRLPMPVDDMAMTWLSSSMLLDDSPLQCVTLLEIKQKGQSISLVQAAFGVDRNIESESSLQCNGDPDCLPVFSKTSTLQKQRW